jgi:DNA-binding transcriptional regulator/RsmH inhibitor MraZ
MSELPSNNGTELIKESDINVNDVLCGRGTKYRTHSGNQTYHSLVKHFIPDYANAAKKVDKTRISKAIVDAVNSSNPSGRFLIETKDGSFRIMVDSKAREKTSQLLRENVMIGKTNHRTMYQKKKFDKFLKKTNLNSPDYRDPFHQQFYPNSRNLMSTGQNDTVGMREIIGFPPQEHYNTAGNRTSHNHSYYLNNPQRELPFANTREEGPPRYPAQHYLHDKFITHTPHFHNPINALNTQTITPNNVTPRMSLWRPFSSNDIHYAERMRNWTTQSWPQAPLVRRHSWTGHPEFSHHEGV